MTCCLYSEARVSSKRLRNLGEVFSSFVKKALVQTPLGIIPNAKLSSWSGVRINSRNLRNKNEKRALRFLIKVRVKIESNKFKTINSVEIKKVDKRTFRVSEEDIKLES